MASRRNNPYTEKDEHSLRARAQGYPARSVFKLQEIDKRCRLLRRGARVLDLGAAPGSWSLFAAERVGAEGKVVAIDLSAIEQVFPKQVTVLQGDAFEARAELAALGPYDVVVSDMAPRTSGTRFRDQAHSFDLCMGALELAQELSAPGAHFVAKIFMSGDFPKAKQAVGRAYGKCRVVRPEATRSNSTEVFLVGLGLRPS